MKDFICCCKGFESLKMQAKNKKDAIKWYSLSVNCDPKNVKCWLNI